jgi:HAMP domain-containing protein
VSTTATQAHPGNGKAQAQPKPEETTPKPAAPAAPTSVKPPLSWLGRRRNYLISPRQQLPGTILATAATLFMVVLLNVNLQQSTEWNTRVFLHEFPGLEQQVRQTTNLRSALMYVFSAVLVVGVFAFSVVRSHRTAGPVVRIQNCMKAVQEGKLGTRIKLRRHDNLTEIADAFNAMMDTLERRARHQSSSLETCILALENSGSHQTGRDCARKLRELLDDERGPVQS